MFSLCMMLSKDEGIYVYDHCSSISVYRNGTVYRAPESGRNKGTNLVASDFMNIFDPYVVGILGNQVCAISHFVFASILNILHIFMV